MKTLPLDLLKSEESVNFRYELDLEREAPSFSSGWSPPLTLSLSTPMTIPMGGGLLPAEDVSGHS